jgi:hypothetical protein
MPKFEKQVLHNLQQQPNGTAGKEAASAIGQGSDRSETSTGR